MPVLDVACDLCFRQFLPDAVIESRTINNKRVFICVEDANRLLEYLGANRTQREELLKRWLA
jgi:hypothetical protein